MRRTVIVDGHRYCTGHCGRLLPLSKFYRLPNGYFGSECRDCDRVRAIERYRALPTYRRERRLRSMRAYETRRTPRVRIRRAA